MLSASVVGRRSQMLSVRGVTGKVIADDEALLVKHYNRSAWLSRLIAELQSVIVSFESYHNNDIPTQLLSGILSSFSSVLENRRKHNRLITLLSELIDLQYFTWKACTCVTRCCCCSFVAGCGRLYTRCHTDWRLRWRQTVSCSVVLRGSAALASCVYICFWRNWLQR